MKNLNLIPLFTLALVLALGATGCKRKGYVTPLPGQNSGAPSGNIGDLPPGPPIEPSGGGDSVKIGGGDTANFDLSNYNEDRAALAAHTVHFEYDSAVIRANEEGNVTAAADALKADPSARLLIEGHCDERGTEEYNRSLGERRALGLREALAKQGVDPARVRTLSYGEDRPASPGHSESAWSQNRRGEFVLLHPKEGA